MLTLYNVQGISPPHIVTTPLAAVLNVMDFSFSSVFSAFAKGCCYPLCVCPHGTTAGRSFVKFCIRDCLESLSIKFRFG